MTRRTIEILAAVLGGLALVVIAWRAIDVLLLGFAGILFAIFLHMSAGFISRFTGLSMRWALVGLVLFLVIALTLTFWLFGSRFAAQTDEIVDASRSGLRSLEDWIRQYAWGEWILSRGGSTMSAVSSSALSSVPGAISGVAWVGAAFLIVVFIGIYLAASPHFYLNGAVKLLPAKWQAQARSMANTTGEALKWWLLGRLLGMAVIAVLTVIGLLLIGVPLPYTLGFIAGLSNFVPNIGPILSVVPAALLALTVSPATAGWVLLLYAAIQALESYVLTPNIERRFVHLPAALIIFVQVLAGVLLGLPGMALATPLLVVAFVAIKEQVRSRAPRNPDR